MTAALCLPGVVHAACADLAGTSLKDGAIVTAVVQEGQAPGRSYCRVTATLSPVKDSQIGFELWLPESGWNGKFEMVGNGGYSSNIDGRAMAALLAKGYAVAATDTGHSGDDPAFARGRPESIIDWGYRAVHLTAVSAKSITQRYYGKAPTYSYFAGCSTGGHQALMEAQRFPTDFDGIIAGDPGNNRTRLNLGFLWMFDKTHTPDGMPILTVDKLRLVNAAVLTACAGKDGGLPGDTFLTNPFVCGFDPKGLVCINGQATDCLSVTEAAAISAVYQGATNPRTGQRLFQGWVKGSEAGEGFVKGLPGWSLYWADPAHPTQPARLNFWRDWVFNDPSWDPASFDFDADADRLQAVLGAKIDAVNPDLSAFEAAGGKLLQYHGLADPVVPPMDSVAYYESVKQMNSGARATDAFYRLFLVPGMQHCAGGEGPYAIDPQTALEDWVEHQKVPEFLVGQKFIDDQPAKGTAFSRPVCAYPEVAAYQAGDPNKADSFVCRAAKKS